MEIEAYLDGYNEEVLKAAGIENPVSCGLMSRSKSWSNIDELLLGTLGKVHIKEHKRDIERASLDEPFMGSVFFCLLLNVG